MSARTISWCRRCNGIDWSDGSHRCPPAWLVWAPELGMTIDDGSRRIGADSAERAAEEWADRHDGDGDYAIVGGNEVVVHVCSEDDRETVARFRVTGESVRQYTARAVKEETGG